MYKLEYDEEWDNHFEKVPIQIQRRFLKRKNKYESHPKFRHELHGVPYFVDEISQYRICFTEPIKDNVRKFYFIGKHKDYLAWLRKHK